jgi:dCTP deaminase
MSTLTRPAIFDLLKRETDPLVITPILAERQIGEASIDVRLGNQFIIFQSHRFQLFSPRENKRVGPKKIQDRQIVPFGNPFILQPGTLALGSTLEYVSIPNDIEAQVEGRSSWARIGLQIATANSIEPGFKGVVTLELSNVSGVALEIRPGIRIAQLVFHRADPPLQTAYAGDRKYRCPVGPQFSRVFDDYDLDAFGPII